MTSWDKEKFESAILTVPDFPKEGIQFKDITPILGNPELLSMGADQLAKQLKNFSPSHVLGIESRGFIYGAMIADRLGCGFVPIRKAGKLPREVISESYDLEYGSASIEIHKDDLKDGDLVVIHDDVLATGGTAEAAAKLIERTGARIAAFSFILELSFLDGRKKLGGLDSFSLISY